MSVNKSKPNTSSNSSQVSKPISLQDVEGVTIVGNEAPINLTDGGAIASNRDVALEAIEKAAELTLGLVSAQAASNEKALGFATAAQEQANKFAYDAGRPEASTLKDSGKVLLWVGGLIAGAMLLKELKLK
ncbi:MAG: hypothetical protein ACYCVW_17100 [Rhodocyclaceae bacterium]